MNKRSRLQLADGARVAVMGGGPSGSFFSYFLLEMAERAGLSLQVDIYEPRDFTVPGPAGCNMCAGLVSETLVQNLATEGIILPTSVVQRGLDSYVLHADTGSVRIESIRHEKRIGTTYRGAGPRGLREIKWGGLDAYLLNLALQKGAHRIRGRVDEVHWVDGPADSDPRARRVQCQSRGAPPQVYDLLAVSTGVNTGARRLLEGLVKDYRPPGTTQCFIREYYLGSETVARYIGPSMHTFMSTVPRIKLAALVPKGDYVSLIMIGRDLDAELVQSFVNDPVVRACLPPGFDWEQGACHCSPRINVRGGARPFGDRIVFIGDAAITRLYKDGIGAAYRAAKAAAAAAIFEGISADDFERRYLPVCRAMENDNTVGKGLFVIIDLIERWRFGRRAVLRMVEHEQAGPEQERRMSGVMWDVFTGSASYQDIFLRCLHPAFWIRLQWFLGSALWESAARRVPPSSPVSPPLRTRLDS